jgi:hypothetical protein
LFRVKYALSSCATLLWRSDDTGAVSTEDRKDEDLVGSGVEQAHDAVLPEADGVAEDGAEEQTKSDDIGDSEQQAVSSDPTESTAKITFFAIHFESTGSAIFFSC